jgi:hypothetical protein
MKVYLKSKVSFAKINNSVNSVTGQEWPSEAGKPTSLVLHSSTSCYILPKIQN